MRARYLATIVVFTSLVLAGLALARTANRGGSLRVVRELARRDVHIFGFRAASPNGGSGGELLSLSAPVPGSHYTLVDQRGYLGLVRSKEVLTVTLPGCGATWFSGDSTYVERPLREVEGMVYAIGPTEVPLRDVRILDTEPQPEGLPAAMVTRSVDLAFDTDGDHGVDLALYSFGCGDSATTMNCVELWSREPRGWEQMVNVSAPRCQ